MNIHTEGPWCLRFDNDKIFVGPSDGLGVICEISNYDKSEQLADAQLISVAPDLLKIAKAYQNLLKTMAHTEDEIRTYQHIKSVIAKAKG